jgi:ADP-heptose:LPS heptosyltransferase
MKKMKKLKNIKKILIINPFGIGDVLFSTPLVSNVHSAYPQADIYYLCNKRVEPLLKNHPRIKKIFVYERDDFEALKKESILKYWGKYARFIHAIRREKIDLAIDLSLNTKFGLYALLAAIPVRAGLNFKKRGRFLTRPVPFHGFSAKHVVEHYLDVLRALAIPVIALDMELFLPPEAEREAAQIIQKKWPAPKLVVGVAPFGGQAFGAQAGIKRWPREHFVAMIERLIRELDARVIIMSGPTEREETRALMSALSEPEKCCETSDCSIPLLAALVKKCDLIIANDTGPLRFANAFRNRTIALFGPVDEVAYGLYPPRECFSLLTHAVACRPCYRSFRLATCERDKECLRGISPDAVYARAEMMLREKTGSDIDTITGDRIDV